MFPYTSTLSISDYMATRDADEDVVLLVIMEAIDQV
jgi:hypothetical protein